MEGLRCSFCEDVFVGPKNIFCKDCMKDSLQLLIEKDKKAHTDGAECCPLCSAKMTQEVVESISTNFLDKVRCLIRILSNRGEDSDATSDTTSSSDGNTTAGVVLTGCGKCEGDVPAVSWCVECQESLCPSCDEVHGIWKDYREHETMTIEEYEHRQGRGPHNQALSDSRKWNLLSTSKQLSAAHGQSQYCKSHSNQPLDLYCETCSCLICKSCTLKDHRNHDFVTASKVESNYRIRESNAQKLQKTTSEYSEHTVPKGVDQKERQKHKKELLWVAKRDYSSLERKNLNLKKGDLLYVINTDMEDRWYARKKHSGQKGYIPSHYIEQLEPFEAEELKCSFCEDVFAEQKTIFCKSCIQDSIVSSFEPDYNEPLDTLNCPFCHHLITQLHSDDLTAHFKQKVTHVIKILSKQNEEIITRVYNGDSNEFGMVMVGCDNCMETRPAISWCATCRIKLCWQCDQVHGKWRKFKAHKTMAVDKFQKKQRKKQAATKRPEYCKTHTKQTLDVYCKTCRTLICQDCTLKDHRHHKFTTVNKSTDRKSKGNSKTISTKEVSQHEHLLISASRNSEVTASLKSPPKEPNFPLFVGKYNYNSRADDELSFKKGDLLYIINTDEGDWWYARSKHTNQEGYIPNNYVVELNRPLDTEK